MEQQDFGKEEEIRTLDRELLLRRVLTENETLKEEISALREQLAYLKKMMYGQKSEKTEVIMENGVQLSVFDEAEQEAEVSPKAIRTTVEVKSHQRKKRTRDGLMASLPVEEVIHPVENKTCDRCGAEMAVIGREKIRDELVYIPARLFLRRHIAEVVKCRACGKEEAHDAERSDIEPCHIRRVEVPAQLLFPGASVTYCIREILQRAAALPS